VILFKNTLNIIGIFALREMHAGHDFDFEIAVALLVILIGMFLLGTLFDFFSGSVILFAVCVVARCQFVRRVFFILTDLTEP